MVSKRKVLIITVLLSGAVSLWGAFYIMPYNGKLPRFNKEKFENTEQEKICLHSIHDHCIPVQKDAKK